MASVLMNEIIDIQAIIDCIFSLKRIQDMIRANNQEYQSWFDIHCSHRLFSSFCGILLGQDYQKIFSKVGG